MSEFFKLHIEKFLLLFEEGYVNTKYIVKSDFFLQICVMQQKNDKQIIIKKMSTNVRDDYVL